MRKVSRNQVLEKLRSANPWWGAQDRAALPFRTLRPRRYVQQFLPLAAARAPRRAVLLMGPRRVGKTVLVFHTMDWLMQQGTPPRQVAYIDLQQPLYHGRGLEELTKLAVLASGADDADGMTVCFDEIQYLPGWETHLKALVDSYPQVKFIATGSAAAALRLKSNESGAGRFTDFLLPPLTFYEFLDLTHNAELAQHVPPATVGDRPTVSSPDVQALNQLFVEYVNFGGYPEAVFSREVREDPGRFLRGDIIDKVLLKDLPSLYGISDVQELNALFTTLAYNTGGELSLGELSQSSGVAANTIKRYVEYLESAFLIKVVHRVDQSARRFQRATAFKVYLTNPSLRSALFSALDADDLDMGRVVETAVFAQWFHRPLPGLHYARWKDGEVDLVYLDERTQKPAWAVDVKWSDRYADKPTELKSLRAFCVRNPRCPALATTRTRQGVCTLPEGTVEFLPASLYCYLIGYNSVHGRAEHAAPGVPEIPPESSG